MRGRGEEKRGSPNSDRSPASQVDEARTEKKGEGNKEEMTKEKLNRMKVSDVRLQPEKKTEDKRKMRMRALGHSRVNKLLAGG